MREAIEALDELGVVVKDLDAGLVDFPSERDGEQVGTVLDEPLDERSHLRERGVRLLGREGALRHGATIPAP